MEHYDSTHISKSIMAYLIKGFLLPLALAKYHHIFDVHLLISFQL